MAQAALEVPQRAEASMATMTLMRLRTSARCLIMATCDAAK